MGGGSSKQKTVVKQVTNSPAKQPVDQSPEEFFTKKQVDTKVRSPSVSSSDISSSSDEDKKVIFLDINLMI